MAGEWRETIYGEVAADFTEDELRNLCDPEAGIQTGPFGSQLHQEDYVPVGTPIITVEHLGENRILHEGVPRVSEGDRERLSRYLLRTGDIVFSRVGSVDRRALVRSAEDHWLFSGRCLRVRPDPEKIDSGYLSYFFGLAAFKEHIRAIAVGATMPSLNTSLLSDVVIPHPREIAEQRAIADILGTLDDRIELNRQMNESLEAMARALFKSWFVDFDPVRAKSEGRNPGLPKPLADLFPSSFDDSELGEIPKAWRTSRLGDILELKRGYDLPSVHRRPGKVPIVSSSGFCGTHDEAKARAPGVVTGRYGTIGAVFFVREGFWPLNTALYVRDFKGTNAIYAYHLLQSVAFEKFSDKAAVPGINRNHLHEERMVAPPPAIQESFGRLAGAWLDRKADSERQAHTLTQMRDTLLPKLISGKVRVKDAERFLERTV